MQLHSIDQQISDIKHIPYKPEDALSGDYPDGEFSRPDMSDLLHEIAQKAGSSWYKIGIELGLKHEEMEQIERDHKENQRQFAELFHRWKQQGGTGDVKPYKWKHILDILEFRLSLQNIAKDIRRKLKPPSSVLCVLPQQKLMLPRT